MAKENLFSIGLAISFVWKYFIYIHNLDLFLQIQTHISNYLPDLPDPVCCLYRVSIFLSQNLLNFWNLIWFNLIPGHHADRQNKSRIDAITVYLQKSSGLSPPQCTLWHCHESRCQSNFTHSIKLVTVLLF